MAAELYHQPFFCPDEIESNTIYCFTDGLYISIGTHSGAEGECAFAQQIGITFGQYPDVHFVLCYIICSIG